MRTLSNALFLFFLGTFPAASDSLGDLLEEPGSHAVLDLEVPLPALVPLVEGLVPQTFSDTIYDVAGNLIKDDKIVINARRDPITLSISGGQLHAATSATGSGNFTGDVLFDDISETLEVRADSAAATSATLNENWSLSLDLDGSVHLREAEIRVLGLKLSLRSLFQDKLDREVINGINDLRKETGEPGFLREAASGLWQDACQDIFVDTLNLRSEPYRIAASQPVFADQSMSITVLISSVISLADGELVCPNLPETLVLLD